MNARIFTDAMSQLDDKYINEAISYEAGTAAIIPARKRRPAALIAAIAALLILSLAAVAAIYGDSIQNWFQHQWEKITGQPMSDGQTAVIDHLSQEIGVVQTIGDVTVTVDSATVGDNTFWLLLRAEGLQLSRKKGYYFYEFQMEVEPDLLAEGGGLGSYGLSYEGLDGNGAALFLMNYNFTGTDGYMEDTRPLEITLTLKDFLNDNDRIILAEGEWSYVFSLDRTRLPDTISLPDTEVMLWDYGKGEYVPILIRNIELTNTGIRFQLERHEEINLSIVWICAILKNGAEIGNNGGLGVPLEDGSLISYSFQWQIPIDLDEVEAVQFGNTKIPLP